MGNVEVVDAQEAAEAATGEMVCCNCKCEASEEELVVIVRASQKKGQFDTYRCKGCHRTKARLTRLFQRRADLVDEWEEMS